MKKLLSIVLSMVMVVSFLSGCGAKEEQTSKAETPVSSKETKQIVISFAEHVANIEKQAPHVAKIVSQFQKQNPNIKINLTGSEVSEHLTKMKLAAQTDNLPDILWLEQPIAKQMFSAGYLYDMTDALNKYGINNNLLPGLVHSVTVDGKDIGLPSEVMMVGFFYNKKIFKDNGLEVPTTFEEFMNVIKTLKGKGITPIAIGAKSNFSVWAFQSMLVRYGFFDKLDDLNSGKITWINDDFIHFFEKVKEMTDAGAFSKDVATMDYFQAKEVFLGGKAAMFNSGAWDIAAFEASPIAKEIGFFWGPTFKDGVGKQEKAIKTSGGVYCISAKAAKDPDKLDAIMKFFAYYYGEPGTKIIVEDTHGLPTTKYSGYINPEEHPVFSEMLTKLNDNWESSKEPFSSLPTNVGNALFDAIFGVINKVYTPKQACQVVQDAMNLANNR